MSLNNTQKQHKNMNGLLLLLPILLIATIPAVYADEDTEGVNISLTLNQDEFLLGEDFILTLEFDNAPGITGSLDLMQYVFYNSDTQMTYSGEVQNIESGDTFTLNLNENTGFGSTMFKIDEYTFEYDLQDKDAKGNTTLDVEGILEFKIVEALSDAFDVPSVYFKLDNESGELYYEDDKPFLSLYYEHEEFASGIISVTNATGSYVELETVTPSTFSFMGKSKIPWSYIQPNWDDAITMNGYDTVYYQFKPLEDDGSIISEQSFEVSAVRVTPTEVVIPPAYEFLFELDKDQTAGEIYATGEIPQLTLLYINEDLAFDGIQLYIQTPDTTDSDKLIRTYDMSDFYNADGSYNSFITNEEHWDEIDDDGLVTYYILVRDWNGQTYYIYTLKAELEIPDDDIIIDDPPEYFANISFDKSLAAGESYTTDEKAILTFTYVNMEKDFAYAEIYFGGEFGDELIATYQADEFYDGGEYVYQSINVDNWIDAYENVGAYGDGYYTPYYLRAFDSEGEQLNTIGAAAKWILTPLEDEDGNCPFDYEYVEGECAPIPKGLTCEDGTYLNEDETECLLIETETPLVEEKKRSGGGCADCFPPTMGISNKDGKTYVDNGLILNGQPLQVDLFYTHMPMQYTEIGKMNNVTMTWYENNGASNIDTVQLVLGLEEIGSSLNSGQATIAIEMGHFADDTENPIMDNMIITDPDGIIDTAYASVKLVDCGAVDDDCLQVQLLWKYLKVPEYAVLGANAWDSKRNSFDNTFNDGLTVIDPNYVEPTPAEPYKYTCDDPLPETLMNGGDRNNCHWRMQNLGWLYN